MFREVEERVMNGLRSDISGTSRSEILSMADAVAREKGIDCDEVLQAIEQAVQKASRQKYGLIGEIKAEVSRQTGFVSLYVYREIVDDNILIDETTQISLTEAQVIDKSYQVGNYAKCLLPPLDFSRVAIQTTRQVVHQRVREVSRLRQYGEFKDRIGDIVSGIVKRIEFNHAIVEVTHSECFLSRDQMIPRESFRPGDRIRSYIMNVQQETRGHQVFLSRTHPQFLGKLFAQEIPEIYDGVVQIKAIARDPGSRSKVAVLSLDRSIDPVKSCVGMRGVRVRSVISELHGEKIDILPWSDDRTVFLTRALVPAEVIRVNPDGSQDFVKVIVPDDHLSIALGRRGQNVRLASMLTGLRINIVSESDDLDQKIKDIKNSTSFLVKELEVDDVVARLLVNEGLETIEKVASSQANDLVSVDGFKEGLADELRRRALEWIDKQENFYRQKIRLLRVDESLMNLEGITLKMVVILGERGIKTLDDLGDLALDELIEILPDLDSNQAGNLIMEAREHWFS